MDHCHIIGCHVEQSINMNVAVRLLHVINGNAHSFEFLLYLGKTTLIAAAAGR